MREFDFRTGLGSHPHSAVAALHDGPRVFFSPVHHNSIPGPGTWVLTRAADIRAALQDAETFSSKIMRSNSGLQLIPLELDPPEHPKFRAIMNPIFSPLRMKQLETKVRSLARELAAKCADQGECDFVEDFAKPFPVGIFLDLMGLPVDNMPRFLEWEALIMRDKQTRSAAMQQVSLYLQELITERRRNPTDDLITFAVTAKVDDRLLTDAEVIGICVLLFIAGLDTVTSSFAFHFRHLAEHPADQESLRRDNPPSFRRPWRSCSAPTPWLTPIAMPPKISNLRACRSKKATISPAPRFLHRAIRVNSKIRTRSCSRAAQIRTTPFRTGRTAASARTWRAARSSRASRNG